MPSVMLRETPLRSTSQTRTNRSACSRPVRTKMRAPTDPARSVSAGKGSLVNVRTSGRASIAALLTCLPGGPLLQPPGKQVNNAAIEARPDVLTFTSDPLPADTDLAGSVGARIFVRTGREHADLFVRVCDVDLKGVSRNITDGIRRLSPQTVPAPDVQADGDGIVAVDLELYPTAYRVRAGHRIRVQVSGGAFPRFARNFGTPEPFGVATRALRCRF